MSCLVRSEAKGGAVKAEYPQVRLVYGSIGDLELVKDEASKADVVFHASGGSDEDVPCAQAIIEGISSRETPGYHLHTSGAFTLAVKTMETGLFGERFDDIYNDWDGIDRLNSLPDSAPHRKVDKVVLAADQSRVKTAIIIPTIVYGEGRGPGKRVMAPLFQPFIKQGKVFVLGKGDNIWNNVHIQDLTKLNLLLAEAAVAGGGNASWNERGMYIAENGTHISREMLRLACQVLHRKGIVSSDEPEFLTPEQSKNIDLWFKVMIGADSQGVAIRAKKQLNWKPTMQSFEQELEHDIDREIKNTAK